MPTSIGIFDSGYGGLTVLREIVNVLPAYNYTYLGDNARAPYGPRSFETVYKYTLQAVKWLFEKECPIIILACNTASAKALRTIQQTDLHKIAPDKRVLGVIRPVSEIIGKFTKSNHIGIFGTSGTINSNSYVLEIEKFFPHVQVFQEACPMWVPLIENNEHESEGADYFVKKHINSLLQKSSGIDALVLGCTHYPLLREKIENYLPGNIRIISQGEIVAQSFVDYLKRHPEIENKCDKNGKIDFYTTENPGIFNSPASLFFGNQIKAERAIY